jgi:hypothetical protein
VTVRIQKTTLLVSGFEKGFKKTFLVVFGYSNSKVNNFNLNFELCCVVTTVICHEIITFEYDARVVFGKFDRVLKQINQNLIQPHLIKHEFHVTLVKVQMNVYLSEISLSLDYIYNVC